MPNIDAKTNGWDFAIAVVEGLVTIGASCLIFLCGKYVVGFCMQCTGEGCKYAVEGWETSAKVVGVVCVFYFVCRTKSPKELIKECIKSAVNGVMRLKGKSEVFNCDGEK